MIPYGRQDINQEDIDAVVSVLKSDFLTQGPAVPEFEKKVSDYTGAKHVLALNSATSALHLACLALGLKAGDRVWTSPISFVASANCALYCGAVIDFVDIDQETLNLSIDKLEEKLKQAQKNNTLPKILIPVHLCGLSCDMKEISRLSKIYGFKIIEDASHAIGGKYFGIPIGSCEYSDIVVFSFHPVKIITTAEGGMLLTNQDDLAHKMSLLRSHGITRDPKYMTHEPDGPWYYQQVDLGFNYRMTELQAALGTSQMKRLDSFVSKRQELSLRYFDKLKHLPLKLPYQNVNYYSGLHLFVIRLELNKIKKTKLQVFNELKNKSIGVNLHYIPIHTQPYYLNLGFKVGDFPEAERYYEEAISIPMYSALSIDDQDKVINAISEVLK